MVSLTSWSVDRWWPGLGRKVLPMTSPSWSVPSPLTFSSPPSSPRVLVQYFVEECFGLDSPARVEFDVGGQTYTADTETTAQGYNFRVVTFPPTTASSIAVNVFATPDPAGAQDVPGRCGHPKVGRQGGADGDSVPLGGVSIWYPSSVGCAGGLKTPNDVLVR
jgi:hypothetical protein